MSETPHAGHPGTYRECRHPDCDAYRARYRKRWQLDRERGIARTVDPRRAALHVAALLGAGWTHRAIAGAAGVAPQTVTRLTRGEAKSIGREAEAKILGVQVDQIPSTPSHQTTEPFVSRVGSVRRVQALMFMGYSGRDLRAHGINSCNVLNQQGRWVTRSTHDRVAAVYRELSHVPGPTPRSRREAERRGYVGPAAWEDIDHDLEPSVDRIGWVEGSEDRQRMHLLLTGGYSVNEVCHELGRDYSTVYTYARSRGLLGEQEAS